MENNSTSSSSIVKKHFNDKFLVGLLVGMGLSILFIGIVVGGYYLINANAPKTEDSINNTTSISKTSSPVVTTSVSTTQNIVSNVYTNSKFGFQVTIPTSWIGKYKVVENNAQTMYDNKFGSPIVLEGQIDFYDTQTETSLPNGASVYSIFVTTIANWNADPDNRNSPFLIAKNTQYVFSWSRAQDARYLNTQYAQDFTTMLNDGKKMIDSFKFI